MTSKKRLADAIQNLAVEEPQLRRGEGVYLSVEKPPETESQPAVPQKSKAPAPERIKPGYTIRKDLIKACKQIALDTERPIYEVIEDALEQYIKAYQK